MSFLGDIGIEYGIRFVVVIELGKRVRMERKEEGIIQGDSEQKVFLVGGIAKNIFCKLDKRFFA